MTFDPGSIPEKLRHAYQEKRCAVLVGAGASAGAKLPLWGQLLDLMIEEAQRHKVITSGRAEGYRKLSSMQSVR